MKFLYGNITKQVLTAFYEVYNDLGFGFLEAVYEKAMLIALEQAGLRCARQAPIEVWYRERRVGRYFADILIEGVVIVELKSARALETAHECQLLNYLRATDVEVGLLLNFGPRPQFKRLVFENDRKASRR